MQLLGVDAHSLHEGLIYRKIDARNDQVHSNSNILLFIATKYLINLRFN